MFDSPQGALAQQDGPTVCFRIANLCMSPFWGRLLLGLLGAFVEGPGAAANTIAALTTGPMVSACLQAVYVSRVKDMDSAVHDKMRPDLCVKCS